MAEEFNWEHVTGSAVERLRAPKITPVPAPIVKLAQQSWDGVKKDGEVRHVLRHQFKEGEEARAEAFAKLMKKAGPHTVPPTSVSVVVDPDENGNTLLVAWKAGARRGRGAAKPAEDGHSEEPAAK